MWGLVWLQYIFFTFVTGGTNTNSCNYVAFCVKNTLITVNMINDTWCYLNHDDQLI